MGFSHGHQFSQEECDFILDNYQNYTIEQLVIMMSDLFDYPFSKKQLQGKIRDLEIRKRNLKQNFGKYTPEMCQWLKDNYNTMKLDDLTKMFNEIFSVDFTKSALWHKINRIVEGGIVRDEHKMLTRTQWTKEMVEWLKEHYEDDSYNRLAITMSSVFNCKITDSSLEHKVTRLGLQKSKESIKRYILPNKMSFKKGHIPASKKPIGYERIGIDGFTWVKIAEPDVFKQKHRIIYEQYYGPIPKGYKVVFADKNRQNFSKENLILVSCAELCTMNQNKLIYKGDSEATKSGLIIAKLMIKVRKITNGGNKQINKKMG